MLGDATVLRLGPDRLKVQWTWVGEPQLPVRVALAASADDFIETDGSEVELTAGLVPRPLVLVTPHGGPTVVVAERRLPIAGTLNFRDLGGYAGAGGAHVRWALVYRSDNFATVDEAGWAVLSALGLRSVFDLRHELERDRAPSQVPTGAPISTTHLPIGGEAAEAPDLVELLREGGDSRFGLEFMVDMNRTLLREHAPVFGQLLSDLTIPGRLPAVFHCTAGKDRTGVAAALLLSTLGVSREVILDDYELTTLYRSRHRIEELRPRLEAAGVDVEAVRPFLSAPRPALARALLDVDETWGSIDRYLVEVAGVPPEVLTALRERLLQPAGSAD